MTARFDPNALPGGASARFMLLLATILSICFLEGLIAGGYSVIRTTSLSQSFGYLLGAANVILVIVSSLTIYILHPKIQSRNFGKTKLLAASEHAYTEIFSIAARQKVKLKNVLIDDDIMNSDAVAFGLPRNRSIAIGRGMLLLRVKAPQRFTARISHELAHIKHSDIDVAFFARALIFSLFAVTAACVAWTLMFHLGIVYGAWDYRSLSTVWSSNEQRMIFVSWVLGVLAFGLVMTLKFASLYLIVFIEYRGFIRSREFLADCHASLAVGPSSMIETLSSKTGPETKGFINILRSILRVHPQNSARSASIISLNKVGMPKPLYFLGLGYLVGLLFKIQSVIDSGFHINSSFSDFSRVTPEALSAFFSDLTNNKFYASIVAGEVVVSFLLSGCVVLAFLRLVMQSIMISEKYIYFVKRAAISCMLFSLGRCLEAVINPIDLGQSIPSFDEKWNDLISFFDKVELVYTTAIFTFIILVLFPLSRWIATGRRQRRPLILFWFILSFTLYYAVSQAVFGVIFLYNWTKYSSSLSYMAMTKGVWIGFLFWLSVSLAVAVWLRGGFRRNQTPHAFAPWLSGLQ